ncbi:hypothetical protein EMIHUDRAFT_197249 [Emiliania huxleyi CCMP1516]|uniref:Uncharacterized protein n=2 Tax=Emiliania huxleyi TaxID=2903 RepID=A0A0D3ITZ1_EMIH1|nr:hypothetical protein EMIHUDRAFT_197249 [Emiliania huxleyi CCMP1516]EOD14726.1 hypothetical protein EMIHUDRAFT_197249 [Emiliania huxleyi CCMP1516]|eukprot:XP_005767155.1 hypothetical protein EMIHUDRAFT_197249 [Emiliania huxleyi CCMP1516]
MLLGVTLEPLLNLAPKKVNWDLKRDIEPQMKKLRAATDRAIIDPLSGIRRQKPQPRQNLIREGQNQIESAEPEKSSVDRVLQDWMAKTINPTSDRICRLSVGPYAGREEFSLFRLSFSFLQGERHQPLYFQGNIYATRYP